MILTWVTWDVREPYHSVDAILALCSTVPSARQEAGRAPPPLGPREPAASPGRHAAAADGSCGSRLLVVLKRFYFSSVRATRSLFSDLPLLLPCFLGAAPPW